ncbi:MAG: hypothetical protein V9F00_03590 [Nocardioides sp.]
MRGIGLSLIFAVIVLPLQWITVAETPLGTFRAHQIGLAVLILSVLLLVRPSRFVRGLASVWWLVGCYVAGLALLLAATLLRGEPVNVPVQQAFYLVGTCSAVVAMGLLIRYDQVYRLRWCGVFSVLILLAALGFGLWTNQVHVLKVLGRAISSGSSEILGYELYRPAFAGFGVSLADAGSQLRHEVFAGVLVGLAIGSFALAYQPDRSSRLVRRLHLVSLAVGVLLMAGSLSRAVTAAALVWPAYIIVRSLIRARLDIGSLAVAVAGSALVSVIALTGVAQVLIDRLRDPVSGRARSQLLEGAFNRLDNAFFWGGMYDDRISSHNFVIDAWLRGGVVVAGLMAAIMVGIWLTLGRLFLASGRLPHWSAPVSFLLALPSVRMLTIGAGLMTPPEWIGMGLGVFLTGVALANRERIGAPDETLPTPVPRRTSPAEAHTSAPALAPAPPVPAIPSGSSVPSITPGERR